MCHHHSHKNLLIRLCTAAVLFIISGLSGDNLFFIAAYIIAGYDIILKAFKNIINGEIFDENFLMSIASLGAITIGEYPEAAAVMILYQLGEYLQHKAVEKTKKSITNLMDIRPDYANIECNGKLIKTDPKDIKIGEIITVKTGEKIPLDGVVIDGFANIDTSALTGESMPVHLKSGDLAISGSINLNGLLKIKVEKEFSESTVSKILELVEHAQSKKSKTENFITKFAKYYTPIVVLCALLLAVIPPIILDTDFSIWFERALTFLVISCPCALVISIPLTFFAGIGGASKEGILIKGACYLEILSKPYAIVFDKTGTLTKGTFTVKKICPQNSFTEDEILKFAANAEKYSDHPIALSIKKAYQNPNLNAENIEEIAGKGIKASVENSKILVGNSDLMENFHIKYTKHDNASVYIAINGKFAGYIIISDELKEDTAAAISALKKYKIIMLTGDNKKFADYIGKQAGISEIYSNLLPHQKVEKIEELIDENRDSVIFVGDGINDAPVLTRADVGIAMGNLDAALEASDIVIMDNKPSKVAKAITLSQKTMKIVKENIILTLMIKFLFLVLGSFGIITMWGAVFADVGVTLLAIANSLRTIINKKIFYDKLILWTEKL